MRKFGLITDSLNQGNYKKYIFKDASIVSLSFLGGSREIHRLDESNLDLFDMFKNESFDLMKPNLDQFIKAFKKQKALGYEYVIYLASSIGNAKMEQFARLAQTIINDSNFIVIPTHTFGPGIDFIVELLHYYQSQDLSIQQLIKKVEESITESLFLIQSKNIIVKSNQNKLMNMLLKLIPYQYVISFNDEYKFKFKAMKKDHILNFILNQIELKIKEGYEPYIKIAYCTSVEEAKLLHHFIYQKYPNLNIQIYGELPFVVAKKLGINGMGIFIGVLT